jgi:hypothetical protein
MSKSIRVTHKIFVQAGICAVALMLPLGTAADAKPEPGPVVIRGIPSTAPASAELRLAYLATFPDGSLEAALDKLNVGAMQAGPTLIPDTNPTITPLPGAMLVGITRPVGLSPDLIPSQSIWATPVNFGPGSISRISATFIAPVGPYATTGGFAMGLVAKTGGKDDLGESEPKIAVTVNVRPNQILRFQVPFGSAEPRNMVLPQAAEDAIVSTTDPQPFTIELTIDRNEGRGTATLTVIDQVFSLEPFPLADFLADSGPTITAMGPGIAVNSNAPGQTASVKVREFRIYTNVGG